MVPTFPLLTKEEQLITLLCPATADLAKCVSKFLGIISDTRKEIDWGMRLQQVQQYIQQKYQPDI